MEERFEPGAGGAGTPRCTVLFVDDNAEVVLLFRRLLTEDGDLEWVGSLDRADALESEVRRLAPEVVVLDLTMSGRSPLEAASAAVRAVPGVRVIAFSGHDDPDTVARALDAGCWGLVSKHAAPAALVDAVRRACRGEPPALTR